MMGLLWVVLFVALTGTHLGYGLPVRPTPQAYPHDASTANAYEGWGSEGAYAAVPALALVLTAVGLLFGCTWCYRHKDCKPNEGADNQLFTASAAHLHEATRSQPPDSGFSEPANNNISEDNNNGPISLREMQNIANNNAAAYIVSENEERNRVSRESVVEFEPLPTGIRVADPLEHCADWFGVEDFSRNRLQYLREIGRGWFGRVVEGEIDDAGTTSPVAVKILNQNASLEDKARFLDEAKMYRDVRHENILAFVGKCLQEDPWILIFEFCPMDLQQYLVLNRPKMAILNESGVPLRLMCDVTGALAYLHSRGYLYGNVWSGGVLVRGTAENARGVLGRYAAQEQNDTAESRAHGAQTSSTSTSAEVWCVGTLVWEVCAWGAAPPVAPTAVPAATPPPPDLPCPYRSHLYQVMQLCWHPNPECRPTSAQVHALINHLYMTHTDASDVSQDDGYGSTDFEERWQRLKPNTIPKIDEHVAIIHAPSTSMASHFTGSDQEFDNAPTISQCQDTLSVDMDTAVSRSSSIMSDKDPLSVQLKSESLTNLHGSLEDVRNIYLTHNEMAVLECHQGNISLEESREKEQDRSDSSMDPWLKDIIAGSHDDVSYYKDVSDVIKNLDNILNSEKTSSSESSHQASPSRDNLSLDCKKDYPMPSCMVKSPGINNFQNILASGFAAKPEDEPCEDEDTDRDTIGTLSHSFERHSDTVSQHTLENLTPDTPNKDIETVYNIKDSVGLPKSVEEKFELDKESAKSVQHDKLPKGIDIVSSDSEIPKLKELCVSSINSVSETSIEQLNVIKDCQTPCDNNFTEIRTDIKEETKSIDDIGKPNVDSEPLEDVGKIDTVEKLQKEKSVIVEEVLPESVHEITGNNNVIGALPIIETTKHVTKVNEISDIEPKVNDENIPLPHDPFMHDDLIVMRTKCSLEAFNEMASEVNVAEEKPDVEQKAAEKSDLENVAASHMTPDSVQNIIDREKPHDTNNILENKETEMVVSLEESMPPQVCHHMCMPPDIVQNKNANNIKSETEKVNDLKEYGNNKEDNTLHRSETEELIEPKYQILKTNSTVYMDLISNTSSDIFDHTIDNSNEALADNTIKLDSNIKHVIQFCLESAPTENSCCIVNNESTVYLDLPSFEVKKETDNFLHMEKIKSSTHTADNIFASTPKGSDSSSENQHELTLENSINDNETENFSVIENLFKDNKIQALSDLEDSVEWNKIQDMSEIGTLVKGDETKVLSEIEKNAKENETQVLSESETSVKHNETQVLLGLQSSISDIESIDISVNKNSVKDNETQLLSGIQTSITDNETIVLSEIGNSIKDKETKALSEIDNLKKNETQILSNIENSVHENDTKVLPEFETSVKVNETQVLSGIQSSFVDKESIAFSGTENSVIDNENQVLPRNENTFKENETQMLSNTENSEKDNETQVLPELETSIKVNETQVLSEIQSSFADKESIAFSGTENSVIDNENQVLPRNENTFKENDTQMLSNIENSEKDNEIQVLPEFETSVKVNETQVLPGIQSSFVDNEAIAFYGTENSVIENENQVLPRNDNTFKENESQMLLNTENSEKDIETVVLPELETSIKVNETQVLSGIQSSFADKESITFSGTENSVIDNENQVLPRNDNTFKENESQMLLNTENSEKDNETEVLSGTKSSFADKESIAFSGTENSVIDNENQVLPRNENTFKENETQILSNIENSDNDNEIQVLPKFETSVKVNETRVLSGIQSSFVDNESIAFSGTENSVIDNENQVQSRNENIFKENETQMLSNTENSEKGNETQVLPDFETSAKNNETQVLSEIENSFKESETQVLSIENSVKFNETQVLPEKKNESHILTGIEQLVNDYETRVLPGIGTSAIENESRVLMNTKNSVKDDESQEKRIKENEVLVSSEFKVPDYGPGVTVTKLEQRYVPDSMSPFESPTKSHHTDTYDENSSVVLGPFENCTLELFKGIKSSVDNIDIPKEELLAFSSNFSEMNLATPSPLRDGNFLNEVPDILHDDVQFDDIEVISEVRTDPSEPLSDDTDQSATEKHVSPSTPPNSPGIFLASTSQQKYLVDIDLNSEPMPQDPDFNLQKEIELNQIELQITSKLAMAENENNLNIEYSGPLTVEGLVEEGVLMRESDPIPESYLAGNGGSLEDLRENLSLDEECVKALRNELELKLPLAQVAAIEPPLELETDADSDLEAPETWAPAPPELVVSYPPALSPIAEETRQQLSAYENDINWNTSARTESSESYPEPCNNSTDDVTELPTAAQDQSTYTLPSKEHSPHNTYTVQKEIMSSKEITMSADSLNASPFRKPIIDHQSPVDDTTYNKNDDEKESNCERISQVSPFLLSPTTETSAPDNSDNFDNATGVSTLSKTTLPTDAKLSKPSETQCLSKATSIDSWCSNDTLYNVEENFDDLAMDPDVPIDFEPEKEEGGSESTDTLTHNDDEKELSHCSTYIVHDSKSEVCETFSPDSITANDNYTYTKVKTEAAATPLILNKSEQNDSTKTKDLAYGTLTSGQPSYSTCATEIASNIDDVWKLQQPEMVRRSPIPDDINITPPKFVENKDILDESSPKLASEPCIKKMDSVEMPCLQDNSVEESKIIETEVSSIEVVNSPESNYRHMAPSQTSTPLTEVPADTNMGEGIPMKLPEIKTESPECSMKVSNFTSFQLSAEVRPQDLCSDMSNECTNHDTEQLLEGESKTLSRNINIDSMIVSETTPTYSDFESSATTKPQDVQSKSSQSLENGVSSEGFRQFENSARNRPQDLSSVIDASCLLLNSERMSSDFAMTISTISNEPTKLEVSPPNISNLIESHLVNIREPSNMFLINVDEEEETEQPHSIIITESPMDAFKESPNKTYDSHAEVKLIDLNLTYDSHRESAPNTQQSLVNNSGENIHLKINGANEQEVNFIDSYENKSPKAETSHFVKEEINSTNVSDTENITNRSLTEDNAENDDIKCNGSSEKFAIVNFLSETFEELIESNVDDSDTKVNDEQVNQDETLEMISPTDNKTAKDVTLDVEPVAEEEITSNGVTELEDGKMTSVTEDFLQNEKKFCQIDSYLPLLSDIRFTGPATEIMSTSFTQDSPTEATSPECEQCEQESKPNIAAEIAKEWDSDSDSHSSNSSSGEFIWKDGDGHETSVVPSTHFDHQRGNGPQPDGADNGDRGASDGGVASDGSGDSGSGSEGDEVEFVPSSWDCRAAPSKSSLRSLEAQADSKKRVVFKRQKYHCVYEYPREVADLDAHSPAYLPDLSTYSEWSPSSMEEAELGYGQLFSSAPSLDLYPIPAGIAFGADYDEDFFISSSARPFESLGIMSTTSQFFPGMHIKNSLLERDIADDINEDFPPPPSPLPPTTTTTTTTLLPTRTPSLDFTTPDSGVEDITPVSTIDDDFKAKKLTETELTWRPVDSASSSESVSPSSPGGEALGGLRHTRDKLKLDLPPSPHIPPSPRHNRVFNFVLDKPKRRSQEERPVETGTTPLVMTDETPIVTTTLPLPKDCEELPAPEPTFSTFGKSVQKPEPEQKAIILTDEIQDAEPEVKVESPKVVEAVKGEGTVLDSGDEDSGIESSSKATLERNKTPNVS